MLLTLYAVISTLSHRKTVESCIAVVREVEAKYQVIKKQFPLEQEKKNQPKSNKRSKQWSWKDKQNTRSRGRGPDPEAPEGLCGMRASWQQFQQTLDAHFTCCILLLRNGSML